MSFNTPDKQASTSLGSNTGGSKPTFSFGASTKGATQPAFGFASNANSSNAGFGFNTDASNNSAGGTGTSSAFGGAQPASTFSFSAKNDNNKPGFSFGNNTNNADGLNTGAFNFNIGDKKSDANSAKPLGTSAVNEEVNGAAPAFGSSNATSGSLFGKKDDAKPTLFGAKSSGTSTSLFGAKPSGASPSLFGAKPSGASSSLFGGQSSEKSEPPSFQNQNSTGTSKPSFSFGNIKSDSASKPSLFGAKVQEMGKSSEPATLNSGAAQSSAPSFSFGNKAASSTPPLNLGGNSNTQKSSGTFGFGANSATPSAPINFGAAKDETSSKTKPLFNFNSEKNPESAANASSEPVVTGAGSSAAAPLFSLNGSKDTASKPTSFSFGSKKEVNTKSDTKPAFSFGSNEGTSKPEVFSMGKKDNEPSLALGSKKAEDKPTAAFSFGTKSSVNKSDDLPNKEAGKPAFSFNNKIGDNTQSSEEAGREKPSTTDSNFSFGGKKSTAEKHGASTNSESKGFSFGGNKDGPGTQDNSKTGAKGFSFGTAKEAETNKSASNATIGSTFGAQKEEQKKDLGEANLSTSKTAAQSLNPKVVEPIPVSLDNKTLDDLITKWTEQLSGAATHFNEFSKKTNEWDQVLVKGGQQISQLYADTLLAEQSQNRIDESLQYVERQQNELETFLNSYENKTETLLSEVLSTNGSGSANNNDQKREQAYHTAETLDENLNSLSLNLSSLIAEINEVSNTFNKATTINMHNKDENTQLIKILNSHLEALKSLDNNSSGLENKIKLLSK